MIPRRPKTGCPNDTFDGLSTCFCEDHCSWEVCRLINPPYNCISNIQGKVVWAWDTIGETWVAQGK